LGKKWSGQELEHNDSKYLCKSEIQRQIWAS